MNTRPTPAGSPAGPRRDLSDRALVHALASAGALLLIYYMVKPWLPPEWHASGSPVLQSLAIAGSILLLMPLAFVVAKRGGKSTAPTHWFAAHISASIIGFILVAIHAAGRIGRPPILLLLALVVLALSGAIARLRLSRHMATTLGTKRAPFRGVDPELQGRLRELIARKIEVLKALDPAASEATFSVTLRHVLRAPLLSLTYARLAREESTLIGARASVGAAQAWWRPLHIALAYLFLAGLAIHVVVVTFFAGYVAGGRPITWWHLAAW